MLIVTPIVGFCGCSVYCCALLYVHHLNGEVRAGNFTLFVFLGPELQCLLKVKEDLSSVLIFQHGIYKILNKLPRSMQYLRSKISCDLQKK